MRILSTAGIPLTFDACIAIIIQTLGFQPRRRWIRYLPGMRENRYKNAIACIDCNRNRRCPPYNSSSPTTMFNQSVGPNMKFSFVRNASFGIALSLVFSVQTTQAQVTGAAATTKLPGSFGGPGVTGSSRLELATSNPIFSSGSSVSGSTSTPGTTGATGATGLGGQTQTGNAFGANAFSNTTGGLGGAGGLGGGLGGLGGLGGGRVGGLGGLGGLGGGGLGGGGMGSTSAQAKKQIRPIVKPDIEVERVSAKTTATNAQQRLSRIQFPKKLRGVTSSVEGDVVVLRGEVATESDKKMVERLLKLEPGIDSVRNEVKVQSNSVERIQGKPNL